MSALERKPKVPAATPDEDLGPGTNRRGIPRSPSQLAWRREFLEATRVGSSGSRRNSRGTPSFPPQLEKIQEILPSTCDEALFYCKNVPFFLCDKWKESGGGKWASSVLLLALIVPHQLYCNLTPEHLTLRRIRYQLEPVAKSSGRESLPEGK